MMGIKDNLLNTAKRGASMAAAKATEAFDKADELGGDLRDYLLERKDVPVLRKIGERMAKLGGVRIEDDAEAVDRKRAEAMEAAAAAAPPPSAAEAAEKEAAKGLGDPEVAAQVYGRESCPWTGRAITLLNDGKIDFDFVELDEPENRPFEGKLTSETKQDTVPYVFLRGEFVGGYNELNEVVRLGQLEMRTSADAAAQAAAAKTEIAKRN